MKKDSTILDTYYSEIERVSELITHTYTSVPEDATEKEIFCLRVEYWVQTIMAEDNIIKMFGDKINEVKEYLTARISDTSNVILKAKYNHFIFILTKNNNYCHEAILYYQQALTAAFQDKNKEYYELRVDEIFEKILELSGRIKYQLPELKKQITGYLSDDTIADKLKTRLFLSVKERNVFTPKESESFPPLFIKLAQSTADAAWVEHNLNIALFFASKTQDQQLIQKIYELLGDNELKGIIPDDDNNLAIPHLNEQIYEESINYYQKAKCDEKLKQVGKLHEKNKTKKRYIPIRIKTEVSEELIDALNSQLEYISDQSSLAIVVNLIFCKQFLFPSNEKLNEEIQNRGTYFHEQHFSPVQVDLNENHKKSNSDDNIKFQYYGIMMRGNIDFIIRSIARCIEKRKLSYKKLYNILNKYTVLGREFTRELNNGTAVSYTWLSIVDIGFENFFVQFRRLQNGKVADWRICIDVLALKFEGIFREMLAINGATITKYKDGNTSLITLEQMIRLESDDIKDAFCKSFDNDDLNLFQYIYSSIAQCRNIRNEVAHCYYLPQMYTIEKALLVVLGILRLAKFAPKSDANLE